LTFSSQLAAASLAGDFSALSRGSSRSSESSWGCSEQALRDRLPPALGRLLQGACRGRDEPRPTCAGFAFILPPASFLAPPPSTTLCVHTRQAPKILTSAARHHPPLLVPPSWSLTTSTAYSAPRFRACCSSSRPWGSSRFCPDRGLRRAHPVTSPRCSHPSTKSPPQQPVRITAPCCPLAVPALRRGPATPRLYSTDESVV
jgi:hypothetical protein